MKLVLRWSLLLVVSILSVNTQLMAQNKPKENSEIAAIRAVLDAQREAWNLGNIEGYMDGYERSEQTVFVSGDTVTHGWQTVLDRYKKGYDTKEKMGTLSFTVLDISLIGKDSAVVLGRWSLKRAQDQPHGTFTLIFKHGKQGWRIIHDHTSAA